MSGRLRIPTATYRLQFNRDFGFRDATALVSYLNRLGISDIYASPILKARKGSSHGYDVTDPTRLNPGLGSEKEFDALSREIKKQGMGLLLDIVPNHMAASPENPWWRDVMEKGENSPFAGFFDTDWLNFAGASGKATGHRRFFDIGDMVGMRVENPGVLEATHSLVFHLIAERKVTGLRLDHIDGLYDPLEYLLRLRQHIAPRSGETTNFYIVVEKILSGDETIPAEWPVSGTTGYDFIKMLTACFVDSDGLEPLHRIYSDFTGLKITFRSLVYEKKKQAMLELFPGEMEALGSYLAHLARQTGNKISPGEASRAILEVTAGLPVYRTYTRTVAVAAKDRIRIEGAFREAANHNAPQNTALTFLKKVLLLDFSAGPAPEQKSGWLNFIMRWQQLTGAIMAKGFEDTALYNYNRLVSLNEVGDDPASRGLSMEEFHRWNLKRAKRWPHTLNATSTHDTKRSEDVRARINVLSEIPDEWRQALGRWQGWNQAKKLKSGGLFVPEPNTEILLYQTMIGSWPLSAEEIPDYKERLKAYMIKAVREAKALTSWIKINQEYEGFILRFIDSILDDSAENDFLNEFLEFQAKTAYCGALNSLSQLLLKVASPGVPDFYQGTELWDFSLVDPDNRRPVDFIKRRELLDSLVKTEANGEPPPIEDMLSDWKDSRVKLYVTYKALNARRAYHELFEKGSYLPLAMTGKKQEHVCAFARHRGEGWALIAIPRLVAKLAGGNVPPVGKKVWGNGYILLPEGAPPKWVNILTGETVSGGKGIALAELFHRSPTAMLLSET